MVIKKENEILKNLLTRKENEILLKEKIAGDMTYLENELKTTKKDLEQTKINNKELFDFNEKSVSQIKILEVSK